MIDGAVSITTDQGSVAYEEGSTVNLNDGAQLSFVDGGVSFVNEDGPSIEIPADGPIVMEINDEVSITIPDEGGFEIDGGDSGNSFSVDSMGVVDADFECGFTMAVDAEGNASIETSDGASINVYEDNSVAVVATDATSVVLDPAGEVSVQAYDGSDVAIADDGLTVSTALDVEITVAEDGSFDLPAAPEPDWSTYQAEVVEPLVEVAVAYAEEAPALYDEAGIELPPVDEVFEAAVAAPADQPVMEAAPADQPVMEPAPAVEVNDFAPADAGVSVDDAGFAVAPEAPAGEFMPGPDSSVFPDEIAAPADAPTQADAAVVPSDDADSPDTEA
jgi:hypothetical protein